MALGNVEEQVSSFQVDVVDGGQSSIGYSGSPSEALDSPIIDVKSSTVGGKISNSMVSGGLSAAPGRRLKVTKVPNYTAIY